MPTYRFKIYGDASISGYVEVNAPSEDEAYEMIKDGTWDEEDIDIDSVDHFDDIQFSEIVDGEEYPDEYTDSDSHGDGVD